MTHKTTLDGATLSCEVFPGPSAQIGRQNTASLFRTIYSLSATIDLSRTRFSDHETVVPSRGWSRQNAVNVKPPLQPRLGTIVSWSLMRY
jgi:hypothetical protein